MIAHDEFEFAIKVYYLRYSVDTTLCALTYIYVGRSENQPYIFKTAPVQAFPIRLSVIFKNFIIYGLGRHLYIVISICFFDLSNTKSFSTY